MIKNWKYSFSGFYCPSTAKCVHLMKVIKIMHSKHFLRKGGPIHFTRCIMCVWKIFSIFYGVQHLFLNISYVFYFCLFTVEYTNYFRVDSRSSLSDWQVPFINSLWPLCVYSQTHIIRNTNITNAGWRRRSRKRQEKEKCATQPPIFSNISNAINILNKPILHKDLFNIINCKVSLHVSI